MPSLRRQSLDPEDLVLAHVGAMDVCAQGLKAAVALQEDGGLEAARAERYAGWDGPRSGKAMMESDLSEIAERVRAERHKARAALRPSGTSGKSGEPGDRSDLRIRIRQRAPDWAAMFAAPDRCTISVAHFTCKNKVMALTGFDRLDRFFCRPGECNDVVHRNLLQYHDPSWPPHCVRVWAQSGYLFG